MSVPNSVQTYPRHSTAPTSTALQSYIGHGVKVSQEGGKAVVELWVDRANRPHGILVGVDGENCAVCTSGLIHVKPFANANAGTVLTANNAGSDASEKSQLVAAGSGHWPVGHLVENGLAGQPALALINIAPEALS